MEASTTPLIVLKELSGHSQPQLNTVQSFLADHIETATHIWFTVWCVTALVLLARLWYEYRQQKKSE